MKAFIFDPLWDELITESLLKKLEGSDLELTITKEIAPLGKCKALFEGNEERILCLNPDYVGWQLTSEDYRDIPSLKAILTASTGYEWVDPAFASENKIPICNLVYFNSESVAEWAIMTMLNLARQVPRLIKDEFPLDFDKDYMKYRGIELKGKTAGIIGLGHIGNAIAERCAGLGMNVIYWSKSPKKTRFKYQDLDKIFIDADVLFPAMAKSPETLKLITKELVGSLKPTAMVVDIAHGFKKELILDMVASGKLWGYGFEAEPNNFGKYKGNVWAAPAYAWATDMSMHNCMKKWVDNMIDAANGKFPNKVNT